MRTINDLTAQTAPHRLDKVPTRDVSIGSGSEAEKSVTLEQLWLTERETLAYAGTVNLDFNTASIKTLTLGGNVTFTTSNSDANARPINIAITADGSTRTLTFPVGWKWLMTAPTNIAAGKTGLLSLLCVGSSILAGMAVEP